MQIAVAVVPMPCNSGFLLRISGCARARSENLRSAETEYRCQAHWQKFPGWIQPQCGWLPGPLVTAHAVGHNGQSAFAREFLIAVGFPVRVPVFVIFALAANVAEARQLNSWPYSHYAYASLPTLRLVNLGIIPNLTR